MSERKGRPSCPEIGMKPLPLKRKNPIPLCSHMNAEMHRENDIWLITLSDLLMLLVIFFVILFGMELQKQAPVLTVRTEATDNTAKKTADTVSTEPSLRDISASIEEDLVVTLSREKGSQEVAVRRVAGLVTLTFPERIVFDPGHALLKPSAHATLNKVATFIQERPYLVVEVQGFTDDQPINNSRYPSNWELSVDRATQVARALIGLGVNPYQLSVKGFGEYRSLYPNDSDDNRLKNRRVEIQFSLPSQ